jgi:hypothetical protein
MAYPCCVARQFPIGSGAGESACKSLIERRATHSGMRWRAAGLQAVASRRALHRSGGWAAFWQPHPQRRRPLVVPRPAGPAPAAPSAPRPVAARAAAPRLARRPTGRHDPPPALPPPTPLRPPAPARPAPAHPWRRPLRPRARSA